MVPTLDYDGLNQHVFNAIPLSARRILDLGCGTGGLGKAVKNRQAVEFIGVTYSPSEAVKARSHLDQVIISDLNTFDPSSLGRFDCVVCSHVLEHLYWPAEVLRTVYRTMDQGGRLVVALPNVLAWRQRVRFLRGQFRYTEGGLMDQTHFRFFDWKTARELVAQAGFREVSASAIGVFPLARFLPGIGGWISRAATRSFPGLFGFQFVIVAEPIAERVG